MRAAWYVGAPGTRRRDWLSVLHPPYTAWHLSYVLVGAALAPRLSTSRLVGTLLAFGLAVGVAAHGLDELRGRPLGTSIPAPLLTGVSLAALGGALVIGAVGIGRVGWGLAGFMVVGGTVVIAYNLELWGGRLHNDVTFALAWGAFPVLTAYYAQASTLSLAAVVAAAFAGGLSLAQRVLSTQARDLRRRVARVEGRKVYADGAVEPLSHRSLLAPAERSLMALSWSSCALGVAMVLSRAGR